MDCMGAKGSGTAFVEFDDVRVPKSNYIGDVTCLLRNFVTERLGIALQANRFARVCLAESIEYAKRRVAFNKKLEDQPVVRQKIANMAMRVDATHAYVESLAYRIGKHIAVPNRGTLPPHARIATSLVPSPTARY
jgi:alkylation response protein AidB-like acyl-CoA dehydrogenase